MGHPTTYDMWRFALPSATTLSNSHGDLKRSVSWARRMSTIAPAFDTLDVNDLVLFIEVQIILLDDRLTPVKMIGTLALRHISTVADLLTTFIVDFLENVLNIDNALACFPVDSVCGIWGVLATGLFGAKFLGGHPIYGLELADWLLQLGIQALGAL